MESILLFITLGLGVIFSIFWFLKPKQSMAMGSEPTQSVVTESSADAILPLGQKRVVPESVHQIPRHGLDDNAMSVVYRLVDAGYEGYLVGGCVRDLLAGTLPKDFDVAT